MVNIQLRFWIKIPKPKREGAGSVSNYERQKLQKPYTQGGAAYGFLLNLLKIRNLPVSKMRHFLHLKPSYTKFTLVKRTFKRTKAFAIFKIEIWCMVLIFCLWLQKRIDPRKFGSTREHSLLESLKKFCKAEGIEVYSTMSEIKTAFAERTNWSLKNVFYSDKEDYGYNYIHKISQFDTTLNSRKNWTIELIPKDVKNSDFFFILYSNPLREYKKPKFDNEDRVCISRYDLPFKKCYRPRFTQIFEIVANSSRKLPIYTIKDEQDENNRGKFYQKKVDQSQLTLRLLTKELLFIASAQLFQDETQLLYKLYTRATESGWPMGGCTFKNNPPVNGQKCHRRITHVCR